MKSRWLIILVVIASMLAWITIKHSPFSKESIAGEYAGTVKCASCHEKEFLDWKGSHHDMAMQEANSSTVLGDFNNVIFTSGNQTSTFFIRDGKFFVNMEGPDGKAADFQILYTFGVIPLQQYLVGFPDGRMQCLLIAWDSKENKWFDLHPEENFKPDDWMHWTKGSMTWNSMCADCHSTYLQKDFDPVKNVYNTKWTAINVGCEACHGPGKKHEDYINSRAFRKNRKVKGSYMYLTAGIANKKQVDECGRCHSVRMQVSEAFDHSGNFMDHYVPEILRPALYHSDGQILGEVYEYGSFLQSKMYNRNVYCTSCHHPHSMKLKLEGTLVCGQCHDTRVYDSPKHHFHKQDKEGALCVNCHMPGRYYMVNDYRHDHSFRSPRPDLSVKYGTPNACNDCHTDKSANWSSKAVQAWYGKNRKPHFSEILTAVQSGDINAMPALANLVGDTAQPEIIQATAIWLLSEIPAPANREKIIASLKNENPLIRYYAVSSMEAFLREDKIKYLTPLLTDSVYSIRGNAAYVMAGIPIGLLKQEHRESFMQASKDYENILKMQADFPSGQLQKGQYFHKKNDFINAELAYKDAIKQDSRLPFVYLNLAHLYYQQGRFDEAETNFNILLSLQPDYGDAWFRLALLQAERKNLTKAETSFKKAATLSGNPRHYYNWGLTLQNLGRLAEAEKVFKQGLKIEPDTEYIMYAIGVMYAQNGRTKEARTIVKNLLKLAPANQSYRNLENSLF